MIAKIMNSTTTTNITIECIKIIKIIGSICQYKPVNIHIPISW